MEQSNIQSDTLHAFKVINEYFYSNKKGHAANFADTATLVSSAGQLQLTYLKARNKTGGLP